MSKAKKQHFPTSSTQAHHALALWAAACAEHTLTLFEAELPGDHRPRHALQVVRQWVRGERSMAECRAAAFAAHAAARQATGPAAIAAARSSGHAAAVAHVYTHAPHAGTYATKAAALAAAVPQAAQELEREWQREQLRGDLHPLAFPKST
ncbi:putative immunity protein [Hymenobacter algoricola]|uniref:putative immunity protein n=1 Tax=Hymenobacter algoricola TaxID=486267 RepID=UPI003CD07BE7